MLLDLSVSEGSESNTELKARGCCHWGNGHRVVTCPRRVPMCDTATQKHKGFTGHPCLPGKVSTDPPRG